MEPIKASVIVVACTALLAAGQARQEPPKFRVSVDAVSIDAVVTDEKGEIIRDLTAGDFEVLQDGKRQKIAFVEFVPVATAASLAAAARARASDVPSAVPPSTARQMAGRTILILVDDLGLSFQGMFATQRALRKFIETGLLPSDHVAIVRSGEVSGVQQPPTSDPAVLRAAVAALRYNPASRKMIAPTEDVVMGLHGPVIQDAASGVASLATAGSLAALNLVIEAAREVPGRKTVIFASEGFDPRDPQVLPGLDHAVDQATRAGVVIYALDGQSLQPGGLRASDDISRSPDMLDPRALYAGGGGDTMAPMVRALSADRLRLVQQGQEMLQYMTEPTGGFAVINTNDLAGGLDRISADVRDYYIIGYTPDQNTFAPHHQGPPLHSIAVNVKRPGARVRTRKEFLGVSDPELRPSTTLASQLKRAAISAFSTTTIPLRAQHLPGYTAGRGLFLRTVLHVDAHALSFSPDDNGVTTASADLVGLVFDSKGAQVAEVTNGFNVRRRSAVATPMPGDGIVYTVRVPIEKPGGYQVRFLVRDRRSGEIGSVTGFVSVPNVPGGEFALSGLDLRADAGDTTRESLDSDRFTVEPADALHVYAPGTTVAYAYQIYNAKTPVQSAISLWRDDERLVSLSPVTLTPASSGPFTATGRFAIADDLPTGTYVLRITATTADPKRPDKTRSAVQQATLEVK